MSSDAVSPGSQSQATAACEESESPTLGQTADVGSKPHSAAHCDESEDNTLSHEARRVSGDDGSGRVMLTAGEQGDAFARAMERFNEDDEHRAVVVSTEGAPNVNVNQEGGQLIFTQEATINKTHHHSNTFSARNRQYNVINNYGSLYMGRQPATADDDQASLSSACSRTSNAEVKEQSHAEIELNKELFVETQFYRDAVDLVSQHGVLVITGPPGSGKSTTARAVLRYYRGKGFQPLVLHRYEEWRLLVGKKGRKQILLLEHVFGKKRLNESMLEEWSTIVHIAKQFALRQKDRVLTLFVIGKHILFDMKRVGQELKLQCFDSGDTCLTGNEKMAMIHKHLDLKEETVSEAELHDILTKDRSGAVFPWCCAEYALKRGTEENDSFLYPSIVFVQRVQACLHVRKNRNDAKEMVTQLMRQLKELEDTHGPDCLLQDVLPSEQRTFESHDIGTYILCNGGSFPCRVLYDALGIALGRSLALPELLRVCDTRFLVEHVHTDDVATFHSVCVDRDSGDYQLLLDRIFTDVLSGHLPELCHHILLCNKTFLTDLEVYGKKKDCSTETLLKTVDRKHGLPFLYWSFFASSSILSEWCSRYHSVERVSFHLLLQLLFLSTLLTVDHPVVERVTSVYCDKQANKLPPSVIKLPVPQKEECFSDEMNEKCKQLFTSLRHFAGNPEAAIAAALLTVEYIDGSIHLISNCKSWYLTYRLVSDREVDQKDEAGNTLLQLAVEAGDLKMVQFLIHHGACVTPVSVGDDKETIAMLLQEAALSGDLKVISALIGCGLDINEKDDIGRTALYVASSDGLNNVVSILLQHGANVNSVANRGWTPLLAACLYGHEKVAKQLLQHGAEVNAANDFGRTAFYLACRENHDHIVSLLLQQKADVNAVTKYGFAPLYRACQNGHDKIVTTLLQHKADVNAVTNIGVSPLHMACYRGHGKIVTTLLQNEADVNAVTKKGVSPLYKPCQKGYDKIVTILLQNEADVNAADINGRTPLCAACLGGHHNIVQILLHHGADISVEDENGWTPLHYASVKGRLDVVKLLVENSAKIDASNKNGRTPLHEACRYGHDKVVHILLQQGASLNAEINAVDNLGTSPLSTACFIGCHQVVNILLQFGASVNAVCSIGETPLHNACKSGHQKIVQTLLHSGADIDATTVSGNTPLHYASEMCSVDSVRLLVENGAKINAKDIAEHTPLYYACGYGHEEMVKFYERFFPEKTFPDPRVGGPKSICDTILILMHGGADIDFANQGVTPLYYASANGFVDAVKLLIEKGAEINAFSMDRFPPHSAGCTNGHDDVVSTLLHPGAVVDRIRNDHKDKITPLCVVCLKGNPSVVEALLKSGADISVTVGDGWTPLHCASQGGNVDVLTHLIEHGAVINAVTSVGSSPLYIACYHGHEQFVDKLLEQGANVNAVTDDGMTPLSAASLKGLFSVVQTLLHKGANINITDKEGWAPLHYASESGNMDVVKLLIANGVDDQRCY